MAEIWKPQSIKVYASWVNAILDEASDDLNDWETRFIRDIEYKLIHKWDLTQAQAEKLEQIYANKTK